jgi:murein DD-endopeptidase MepM/ murein hydrolase activator NlpD
LSNFDIRWPLTVASEIPTGVHSGAFGARRKHDIHTGVDLYCDPGTPVQAITEGTVVNILPFTGLLAGSPWWNSTWAVMIEHPALQVVVCYGEIVHDLSLTIGSKVVAGTFLGWVRTVLKKDKGLPMTMLHLETYKPGTLEPVWWYHDQPKPPALLNPTELLYSLT